MKKITFYLFLFLIPLFINAQSFVPSKEKSFTQSVDSKLEQLDKTAISTDILYDRVFPFANLREFNQTSSDTSSMQHFYHAYAEMQIADYLNQNFIMDEKKNVGEYVKTYGDVDVIGFKRVSLA